ncbi:60S ribosomal protein L6, putative [Gryllus bimaculatus]|nr:60S ribosomal protein L6, putative [Gryllus bimaculatus]
MFSVDCVNLFLNLISTFIYIFLQMTNPKKEATAAAPAPAGKGAAKAGAESKAAPAEKKPSKTAIKRAAAAAKAKNAAAAKVKKSRRGGIGKRSRKARATRKEEKSAAHAQKRSASASKDGPPAKKQRRPHREIASGVMKFSRPYKYHRGGTWKFDGKKIKKATPKKPRTIKKEIGGEKNGGFRIVLLKKRRNNYPTADKIRKRPTRGPFSINGVPLRRVSQNFVIATRTRLKIDEKSIPKHLNDDYFKRIRPKKSKKDDSDIFTTKKEKYVPSEQRKADQKAVDAIVENAMKPGMSQHTHGALRKYLKATFGLKRNQKPHFMKF